MWHALFPDEPTTSAGSSVTPLIAPGHTYRSITEKISGVVLSGDIPTGWFVGIAFSLVLLGSLGISAVVLLVVGTGIWGINVPIGWGFAIINFVWWIGIGHAGTLISAILHLLNQQWRTSINRFAEAMTLFAVMCAAMFPLLHTGRPWLAAYWMFPYPNTMGIWPQFRSPLIWDVFAVSTYFTVSLLFWYVGLIPDLATMRDRAKSRASQVIYGMAAMGWRGSALHWQRYEIAYLLLAGLSTPLVVSVHSIVSYRLCGLRHSRLAHDDFSALLCGGCRLRWICDGAHLGHPDASDVQPQRFHHHAPHRQHGQGDARDRAVCCLWLRD